MWLPRSLVGRIALITALAVLASGSVVATFSVLLGSRLTEALEDAHLREGAQIVAWELAESEEDWDKIDHEMQELEQAGIHCAIFDGKRCISGDGKLDLLAPATCADMGSFRACGLAAGKFTIVTARDATGMRDREHATMLAAFLAVLLTALCGTLASFGVARRVVRPLSRLRNRVERVPAEDPGAADLGSHDGLSEVDALRSSLNDSFSRLGIALLQSQRFARDAAHQLRTPLTAMLGEIELTLERAPQDLRPELERVQRLAGRLANLVDRLLILARSEGTPAAEADLDLLEVFEEALDAFPTSSRMRVLGPTMSLHVKGDRTLLVAMLTNAIDNALKYSEGDVEVRLQRDAQTAVVHVLDGGPGVPENERERVFEAFYRSPKMRASEVTGHGIGLALIAHVVRLHGGGARFREGPGAHLELVLPA